MINKLVVLCLMVCVCLHAGAVDKTKDVVQNKKNSTKDSGLNTNISQDLQTVGNYFVKGSYLQFTTTTNLLLWGVAGGVIAYFIKNDERISKKAANKHKNEKILKNISDASIAFNTPILPALLYSIARGQNNEKLHKFTLEYTATLALALTETVVISAIPVHQRPKEENLSDWEVLFRGRSSFPSGHVIGLTALAVKTFQFYGPLYSIPPLMLAVATAFERVQTEKHYYSDVIASGLITFLASEGVRIAAGHSNNHPVYKWIFEHDFNIGYMRHDDALGFKLSLSY